LLAQVPFTPEIRHYRAALLLSRCATVAAAEAGAHEAGGRAAVDHYADLAVAELRAAVANGLRSLSKVDEDQKYLQVLATRPDFQKLMADFEAGGKSK